MKRLCLAILILLTPLAACETDPSVNEAARVCVAEVSGSGRAYLESNAQEIIRDVSDRNIFIARDVAADSAIIARESPSGTCATNERTLTGDEWRDELTARSASNLQSSDTCTFSQVRASNSQMQDLLYDITLSGLGGSAYSGVDRDYSLRVQSDCELAGPFVRAYLARRDIAGGVTQQ